MNRTELNTGIKALNNLRGFVPRSQLNTIRNLFNGEEGSYFVEKMVKLDLLIQGMPKTYEQDGKGDEAVAYLHYFYGGCDWYITEKDMEDEQIQAFGLVNLGYGAELGYISIVDVIAQRGVEIDLYFTPTAIGKLR